MNKPFRIPTLLGLFLVLLLLVGLGFGYDSFVKTEIIASRTTEPRNIMITNVSNTGFTVTWQTGDAATGAIIAEREGMQKQTYYDERDSNTRSLGAFKMHSVPVQIPSGNNAVSFTLLSNGKEYKDNGFSYKITLAPTLTGETTNYDPSFGTVFTTNDSPAEGAIVYLTPADGQVLSAVVGRSGSWIIPLNIARQKDLQSYLQQTERMTIDIAVVYENVQATAITDSLNDSPVPSIVIGKTYDFRKQQAQTTQSAFANFGQSEKVLGEQASSFPLENTLISPSLEVALTEPKEQSVLTTFRPLISGTGIPGNTVLITLGITSPSSYVATIQKNGIFQFSPPNALDAGKQSVTITTNDLEGKPIAITRLFEILKSGTQVLGIATPSATLIPSPTTIAPTQIVIPIPSPTPDQVGQPLPVTGNDTPLIVTTMLASGLMLLGGILFFGL